MRKTILVLMSLIGTSAFGLTLEPGETARIGYTTVTCLESEEKLPFCGVEQGGCFTGDLKVRVGDESFECQSEEEALRRIANFKEVGVCR